MVVTQRLEKKIRGLKEKVRATREKRHSWAIWRRKMGGGQAREVVKDEEFVSRG